MLNVNNLFYTNLFYFYNYSNIHYKNKTVKMHLLFNVNNNNTNTTIHYNNYYKNNTAK